jgi:hypothetical protein
MQQSMKQTASRRTRTIELRCFASTRWTFDDYFPVRRVERRVQMRIVRCSRSLAVVIENVNRRAESHPRSE